MPKFDLIDSKFHCYLVHGFYQIHNLGINFTTVSMEDSPDSRMSLNNVTARNF